MQSNMEELKKMSKQLSGFTIKGTTIDKKQENFMKDFLHNVYFQKMDNVKVQYSADCNISNFTDCSMLLQQLGNQTDRLKSIIEDSFPKREDDLPILNYEDHSEYIVNGFDANVKMSTLEVFTDKWERYTTERNSKELNKE